MSGRLRVSEGDWTCGNRDCQNLNFASREKCNKCGESTKTSSQLVKKAGHEIGEKFAEKSKGLFSANDWQCSKCSNINWARRSTCNVCNAPKVGPEETRTGYGGGFKENENVTYKDQEDSDGEFDEYGRKKKKYRGSIPVIKSGIDSPIITNFIKNVVQNDEEDDDDDDDDDVDLSKYDLSDSDEDSKSAPEPKILKRKSSRSPSGSPKRRRSSSSSSSTSSSSSVRSRSRSRSPRGKQT